MVNSLPRKAVDSVYNLVLQGLAHSWPIPCVCKEVKNVIAARRWKEGNKNIVSLLFSIDVIHSRFATILYEVGMADTGRAFIMPA